MDQGAQDPKGHSDDPMEPKGDSDDPMEPKGDSDPMNQAFIEDDDDDEVMTGVDPNLTWGERELVGLVEEDDEDSQDQVLTQASPQFPQRAVPQQPAMSPSQTPQPMSPMSLLAAPFHVEFASPSISPISWDVLQAALGPPLVFEDSNPQVFPPLPAMPATSSAAAEAEPVAPLEIPPTTEAPLSHVSSTTLTASTISVFTPTPPSPAEKDQSPQAGQEH